MPTGTTTVNFGSGASESNDTLATATVTGQTAIVAGSLVEAWVRVAASADHTVDEHSVESLKIEAGNIVAGTGFTVYALCTEGKTYGVWNINWAWV